MAVTDHLDATDALLDELEKADRDARAAQENVAVMLRKARARVRALRRETEVDWQAAYWELHGDSCQPTCRGHQA